MNKVILLADNDPLLRGILKNALESESYIVEETTNAKETLGKIMQLHEKLDLIVLDIMMPLAGAFEDKDGGMNAGIKILKLIRTEFNSERLRKLPIICHTTRYNEKVKSQLEELNVNVILKGEQSRDTVIAEIQKLTQNIA